MMDELRELYQEVILDHGRHPRNFRHPAEANAEARGQNPMCGDQLTVYLTLDAERRIADCAFEGKGCAISTASASLMTELLRGKTEAEARALFAHFHQLCTGDDDEDHGHEHADAALLQEDDLDRLQVMAGVKQFPVRVKCATLAWHTMNAALEGGGDTASTE
ncbi:MAG TPA: SUF system NifU family Fe-S cluster assembly protein [Alphaproteobacteria bacterium]|nr:SUF system NifU family Fe-S cluster assembly protein [Alphaproteobacteria bacterium]